jgi:hypothetical protein
MANGAEDKAAAAAAAAAASKRRYNPRHKPRGRQGFLLIVAFSSCAKERRTAMLIPDVSGRISTTTFATVREIGQLEGEQGYANNTDEMNCWGAGDGC